MTVSVPTPSLLTGVRAALAATLAAEFEAEGITFGDTMLTDTDASNQAAGAVFSMGWTEDPQYVAQIIVRFGVQIHDASTATDGGFALETPQDYDPTRVEQWVHRAALALKANEHAVGVWFLRVTDGNIDPDAQGQPTRGELIVRAYTNNPFDTPNI